MRERDSVGVSSRFSLSVLSAHRELLFAGYNPRLKIRLC